MWWMSLVLEMCEAHEDDHKKGCIIQLMHPIELDYLDARYDHYKVMFETLASNVGWSKNADWIKSIESHIPECSGKLYIGVGMEHVQLPKKATIDFLYSARQGCMKYRFRNSNSEPYSEWVDAPNADLTCFNSMKQWIDSFCI